MQLLGPPLSVYCELDRRRPGAEVDDDVFIALEHEGGARSHLSMSQVAALAGPRLRVSGTSDALECEAIDPQEQHLAGGMTPGDAEFGAGPPRRTSAGTVELERGRYQAFYEGVREWARDGWPLLSIPPTVCACSTARDRPTRGRGARCSSRRGLAWPDRRAAAHVLSFVATPGQEALLPPGRDPADVAQLVEHFTRNEGVPGSSPGVGFGASAPIHRDRCDGCSDQRCGLLFVVRRSPGFRGSHRAIRVRSRSGRPSRSWRSSDEPVADRAMSCLPGPQSIRPWP